MKKEKECVLVCSKKRTTQTGTWPSILRHIQFIDVRSILLNLIYSTHFFLFYFIFIRSQNWAIFFALNIWYEYIYICTVYLPLNRLVKWMKKPAQHNCLNANANAKKSPCFFIRTAHHSFEVKKKKSTE